MAFHDSASKTVYCLDCDATGVDSGTAGASARRENERRITSRETRIRTKHPILGGLILAVSEEPQSTRAWASGARGEEKLGQRLDSLASERVQVLHDRRIPRSRANIDHIVVSSGGVFVIDAKRYQNARPELRVEGGIIRARREKLIVGGRDRTPLVGGVHKQIDAVTDALDASGINHVPVNGVLCFIDADWPFFGGSFMIDGLHVLWPAKASELISKPGELDVASIDRVFVTLARSLRSA